MVACYSLTAWWTWEFICTYCLVFEGGIVRMRCVLCGVYWLLSSYIIDVKNWQCFLCSDTVLAHRYRHQNTADFGQNMFFLASVAEQFHLINSPVCLYEQRSENTDVILLVKSEEHPFWLYLLFFYCRGRPQEPLIGVWIIFVIFFYLSENVFLELWKGQVEIRLKIS